MPIHLIETPLVIKRGGHTDQLSRRFWGMDRFRVVALCKLLDSGVLSAEQRRLTTDVLHKKCTILAQGARKRGQDGEPYLAVAATYRDAGTRGRGDAETGRHGDAATEEHSLAGAC